MSWEHTEVLWSCFALHLRIVFPLSLALSLSIYIYYIYNIYIYNYQIIVTFLYCWLSLLITSIISISIMQPWLRMAFCCSISSIFTTPKGGLACSMIRWPIWICQEPSFSADIQGHIIAINDSLHEAHPLRDQVIELFDEDPENRQLGYSGYAPPKPLNQCMLKPTKPRPEWPKGRWHKDFA